MADKTEDPYVAFPVPQGTTVYHGGNMYEGGTAASVPQSHTVALGKIKPLADHPLKRSGPTVAELKAAKLEEVAKAPAAKSADPAPAAAQATATDAPKPVQAATDDKPKAQSDKVDAKSVN